MCAFSTGKSKQITTEFFYGHAMISQTLYNAISAACLTFTDADVQKPACATLLQQMNDVVGQFDIYNIYDTCGGEGNARTMQDYHKRLSQPSVVVDDDTSTLPHPQLGPSRTPPGEVSGAVNDYACGGGAMAEQWLAQDSVAKALHVTPGKGGMHYTWGPTNISGDLRPLYKRLAQKYRLLIYSGDTDACVPYWGTEEWTRELGFPVKKDWHPWHAQHLSRAGLQRAGYAIEYDTPTNFKFVTIQGAGHLVPMYKPHFALRMITNFLNGSDFN